MAPPTLPKEERDELEKYTKFLTHKVVQVIIQSRFGEKFKTFSKTIGERSDWFYLAIADNPDIWAETKKIFGNGMPKRGASLNIEISLKTIDDDTLVLETWSLECLEQIDNSNKFSKTIYHKMSLLLKSLLSMTRSSPAYKLSAKQSVDTFLIHYKLYIGEPMVHQLGSGFQRARIGHVMTPLYTLVLNLAYRTDMTISPKCSTHYTDSFLIKSNYYNPNHSSKNGFIEEEIRSINDSNEEDIFQCEISDNTQAMNENFDYSCKNKANGIEEKELAFLETKKVGAFAFNSFKPEQYPELRLPDYGFQHLLQNDKDNNPITHNNNPKTMALPKPVLQPQPKTILDLNCNSQTETELEEEFMMLGIKPSFVEGSKNDVGSFFRDCQSAPSLITFNQQPTLAEQVQQLSSQLPCFESHLTNFDNFIQSLHQMEPIH